MILKCLWEAARQTSQVQIMAIVFCLVLWMGLSCLGFGWVSSLVRCSRRQPGPQAGSARGLADVFVGYKHCGSANVCGSGSVMS